jgi:hypothetical protein
MLTTEDTEARRGHRGHRVSSSDKEILGHYRVRRFYMPGTRLPEWTLLIEVNFAFSATPKLPPHLPL